MHTVNFKRQAGSRTEFKHTPFTQTPPLLSHVSYLTLSFSLTLSSQNPLLFSQKHAGRREGGEKKKRVGGDKRERKQRKLVEEQEGERRGEK